MKLVSLFSGIGGLDIGVKHALSAWVDTPVRTVLLCEKDAFCRSVLARHFPESKIYEDIYDLDETTPEIADGCDVLTMGFPCQDASIMQKDAKGLEGERTGLFFEGWRIALQARAKVVVMENVAAFAVRGADEVREVARKDGYRFESLVLGASHFGAPHSRKRWMGIAWKDTDLINEGWSFSKPAPRTPPRQITYWGRTAWPTLRANKPNGERLDPWFARHDKGHVSTPHIETALRIAHQEQHGEEANHLKMSLAWAEMLMGFPPEYTKIDGRITTAQSHVIGGWDEAWSKAQENRLHDQDRYQPSTRLRALGNAVVPVWAYGMMEHALSYVSAWSAMFATDE